MGVVGMAVLVAHSARRMRLGEWMKSQRAQKLPEEDLIAEPNEAPIWVAARPRYGGFHALVDSR